jgi:GTP-binding protein EngB required for normal cell division
MATDQDVIRSLARVETKVDMIITRFDKLEDRTAAVEKKVWYGSGVAAVLAFIATKFAH